MKNKVFIILLIFTLNSCAITYNSPHPPRSAVYTRSIPNLSGYVTLFCDFHMHTVFSDGYVWPTVRVDEAYYEGLSAIAITDHIERRIFLSNFFDSLNTSYQEALKSQNAKELIIIKGVEITRDMPPGHFNAIFLTDADKLYYDKDNYINAFRAAKEQKAFISWNHPGWEKQQPHSTIWMKEHNQLYEDGMMQGIEVANSGTYFPEAHQWAIEKNLTMMGGTDQHLPMPVFAQGEHRTMTLVFARERTAESIYEALMERRTAVYLKEYIIGENKYLNELFEKSINVEITKNKNSAEITFRNNTELKFYLKKDRHDPRLSYLRFYNLESYIIKPYSKQTITVLFSDNNISGDVNIIVENFIIEPNTPMKYTIKI